VTGIDAVLQEISDDFTNPQTDDERKIYYGAKLGQFLCGLGKILIKSDLCDPDSLPKILPPRGISRKYTAVSKGRLTPLDKAIIRSASELGFSPVN